VSVDITSSSLFTAQEVQDFFESKTRPGEYTQMSRLANLSRDSFIPLTNCLLLELISMEDLAGLNTLDQATVDLFIEEVLSRNFLMVHQAGDLVKKNFVFTDTGINLGDTADEADALSSGNPQKPSSNHGLRYEFFMTRRSYRSYVDSTEFDDAFETEVLPEILASDDFTDISATDVRDVFPLDGDIAMTDSGNPIIDAGMKLAFANAYERLFSYFLPVLENNLVSRLCISSPSLFSKVDSDSAVSSSALDWFFPYRNTRNVLDEVVALMVENSDDTIDEFSQTIADISTFIGDESFEHAPSRALNRFLLFYKIVSLTDGTLSTQQVSDIENGITVLRGKLEALVNMAALIRSESASRLKVTSTDI